MANKQATATSEDKATIVKIIGASDLQLTEENKSNVSSMSYAQCIRVLLQNWRQGTVGCKDRSEVSLTNKKPWKQKGTGRARAGSARSPVWRKGGVSFGPQPRTKTLKVSKNVKQQVFNNLLWQYLDNKAILGLDDSFGGVPKTSLAVKALKSIGVHDKKVILFVSACDMVSQLSFSNIPNVRILLFDQPNPYILSDCKYWIFMNKDMDNFKEMVSAWI